MGGRKWRATVGANGAHGHGLQWGQKRHMCRISTSQIGKLEKTVGAYGNAPFPFLQNAAPRRYKSTARKMETGGKVQQP